MATSRAYKIARWTRCEGFIRRTASLPEAMALAKREGFAAPTAAWLGAFAKMLERGSDRQEPGEHR